MNNLKNKINKIILNIFKENTGIILGDTLILDRWLWISKRLPITKEKLKLLDIGCGGGAFTIKSAKKGYSATGLTWDRSSINKSFKRLKNIKFTGKCNFEIFDARNLDKYIHNNFDIILNCENIEHIIDDKKLMKDISEKLAPGGFLMLTAPNYFYLAISEEDNGPFNGQLHSDSDHLLTEGGGHVRRGYTKSMLVELCNSCGLSVEEISSCSGFFSQKITYFLRILCKKFGPSVLIFTLPFRILPLIFDGFIREIFGFPDYSICLLAYKPRLR
mgnify:CR=1 FL=1|tara:strand:+ start:574 stop:1395 length:822 start_codon:yes stop_codon:yes gene_type:complete